MAAQNFDLLTETEKQVLAEPALCARARAVQALGELGTLTGLDEAQLGAAANVIRSMDKEEAHATYETLSQTNLLLGRLSIDATSQIESTPESAEDAEPGLTPLQSPPPLVEPSFGHQMPELDIEHIFESLETIDDRGEAIGYDRAKTERFLDQINSVGPVVSLIAEDFDHEAFKELALMYKAGVKRTDPENLKTNIACTWAYLAGVDMSEIIIMRSHTKPDAKVQDVHNSRAAFSQGVIKAWQRGRKFELRQPSDIDLDLPEEDLELDQPEEAPVLSLVPAAEPAREERSIDEEPPHVRLAAAYVSSLDIDPSYEAAFRGLIDPNNRGEMTSAKLAVVSKIQEAIDERLDPDEIINQLQTVAPAGRAALRKLLGWYNRNGKTELRAPMPVKEQIIGTPMVQRQEYLDSLYDALDKLLVALETSSDRAVEADVPQIKQVVFEGGRPRLV